MAMNEQTVRNLMAQLGYRGMLAEYETQCDGECPTMSFNERFGILLQAQYDAKRSGRIRNFHQQAKFSQPFACIEDVDYAADRKLDAGLIGELASCSFVSNRENVLVLGASDCGKSFLGCALGNAACRHQVKTKHLRLADMFNLLAKAEAEGKYLRTFNDLARTPLLILDDFLVSIPTIKQVQILLELVERREYGGSTIVCTLLHPSDWQQRIDEKIQANSIHARLVPNAHWIEIGGNTPMRERMGSNG